MGMFDWFKAIAGGKGESSDPAVAHAVVAAAAAPVLEDDPDSGVVAGLNFKTAIDAHMLWKARLEKVINGTTTEQLSVDTVSRDDQCVLGKWVNGPGSAKFGALREFQELKMEHSRFHLNAGDILACALAGDKSGAESRLHTGDYVRVSERVKLHLARLYVQVSGQGIQ
ncbi:MAG: CZB domain-containing protein [Betaproteobacteria bacterium]|nr:CZB domain-containing protein [Betaproteobacteria bacterium]